MSLQEDERLDAIGHALADPTRRAILAHLARSGGETTAALAAIAPSISRFAVMKHLAVLREAGLLRSMDEGKRRRHYREPAAVQPLRDWLAALDRPPGS
ncbi:MAG: ArsR/SmtB family transcription factor [Candidatus Limnocylindrales bacterium]